MAAPLLRIEHLSVDYEVGAGTFHALHDISLTMETGQVLGIVGETGCGKSTLAHAIPRLLREPPARILGGKIRLRGTDLLELPKWQLPLVRGTGIGMIFQEPINSLNPAYRIYDQVAGNRGTVRGPFPIWLRNPKLAEFVAECNRIGTSEADSDDG